MGHLLNFSINLEYTCCLYSRSELRASQSYSDFTQFWDEKRYSSSIVIDKLERNVNFKAHTGIFVISISLQHLYIEDKSNGNCKF